MRTQSEQSCKKFKTQFGLGLLQGGEGEKRENETDMDKDKFYWIS
jgi:hypothetical protein